MKDLQPTCRLAVIQAAPVLFDKRKGLEKALALIERAVREYAPEVIVFPELFLPGYPYGMNFGFSVGERTEEGRAEWLRYYENSLVVPGVETAALCAAAREHGIWLSIGISERDGVTGTLYNSNLIIRPDGTLEPVHRKLRPTGSERVVWGDADRGFFPTAETPWGTMASLICWESYMPLARAALYEKGVTLYLSPNTNDNPEWQVQRLPQIVCRGGSCIVDPFGHYVTQPVWDREEIIFAELDMTQAAAAKMELDVCGHYARPDVLRLTVNDR